MKRLERPQSGLSLLETLVAMMLMTMTLWSLQYLYVGLLKGTRISDARREAVAQADTLLSEWKRQALDTWPVGPGTDAMPSPDRIETEGPVGDNLYKVVLSGRVLNPFYGQSSAVVDDPLLEMQTITVTVYYNEHEDIHNKQRSVTLVGSVSN